MKPKTSREQFEEWYLRMQESQPFEPDWKPELFAAWQASRAALRAEMRKHQHKSNPNGIVYNGISWQSSIAKNRRSTPPTTPPSSLQP